MTWENHTQPSHFNSSVQMAFLLSHTMRQKTLFNVALLLPSLYSRLSSMTEKLTSVWQLHIRQNYLQHQEHTMISTVSNSCSCICICINEHNYPTNVALLFPSLYTRLSGCSAEYYTDGWPSVLRVEASFFGNVD